METLGEPKTQTHARMHTLRGTFLFACYKAQGQVQVFKSCTVGVFK